MISQVSLSRPTPVVVAPFGASGIKFATEVISGFVKAGIDASMGMSRSMLKSGG